MYEKYCVTCTILKLMVINVVVAHAYKTICLCCIFMRALDGFCIVVSEWLYFARASYSAVIVNCMLDLSF